MSFVPIPRLPEAVMDAWGRRASSATAADRAAMFAERFAPALVLERAGIAQEIRQHRAAHLHRARTRRA